MVFVVFKSKSISLTHCAQDYCLTNFSNMSSLNPIINLSPTFIVGALRFPLLPIASFKTCSRLSSTGSNSWNFFPFPMTTVLYVLINSHALSLPILSLLALILFKIVMFSDASTSSAFPHDFQPFLKYAQFISIKISLPHEYVRGY